MRLKKLVLWAIFLAIFLLCLSGCDKVRAWIKEKKNSKLALFGHNPFVNKAA